MDLQVELRQCRNLIKKPWPYNPKIVRNPNKGPKFLNQVPTLELPLVKEEAWDLRFRVWFRVWVQGFHGLGFRFMR